MVDEVPGTESNWRDREQDLLQGIQTSMKYYSRQARHANRLHRTISFIVLVGSVIAPVAVVSSAGASPNISSSLTAFGLDQENIGRIAVAVTIVLAFCEGLRQLFQFDQRWITCIQAREELRRLRDRYLDEQVPNPVGTASWTEKFHQLRQQTQTVMSQEESGFFQRLNSPGKN